MSDYIGDFVVGDTIDVGKFTTVGSTGAPATLLGTPVVSAYPTGSTTQLTAGITLTVDYDGVVGLNNVSVVASVGNGYATATDYDLVITTGTSGGISVVGYTVAKFSLGNRGAALADAVWNETSSGHVLAGTAGQIQWSTIPNIDFTAGEAYLSLLDGGFTNNLLDAILLSLGTGLTLPTTERNALADALLDRASGVETSYTPRQALRLILASASGKLSGAGTPTILIRNVNDTKTRITAGVDGVGNRTSISTDVS